MITIELPWAKPPISSNGSPKWTRPWPIILGGSIPAGNRAARRKAK